MIIFGWFILSIIVGVLGSKREIGGWASFFLSLFFSPIVGIICVMCSKDKRTRKLEDQLAALISEQRRYRAEQMEREESISSYPSPPPPPTAQDDDKINGVSVTHQEPKPNRSHVRIVLVAFIVTVATIVSLAVINSRKAESRLDESFERYKSAHTTDDKDDYGSIRFGIVNTVVDGYDVLKVNLWSQPNSPRKQVFSVTNGQKVKIIDENDDYYKIEYNGMSGWCMKGFVNEL